MVEPSWIAREGLRSAVLFAALSVPTALRADWQYTKWGMTPEQVQTASKGAAVTNNNRGLDAGNEKALLVAPYQSGEFTFKAVFRFDPGNRLVHVGLDLTETSKCPQLVYQLNNTYKVPASRSKDAITYVLRWYDRENGNSVIYFEINKEVCSIKYSPLSNPGTPGGL